MKDETYFMEKTFEVLSEDFELPGKKYIADLIYQKSDLILSEIEKVLAEKIEEMMHNNFDKLQNILYRIDLDQQKVHELYITAIKGNFPSSLAKLIIERQLAKVKSRHFYRMNKDQHEP
jgi:hypothetical protein